MAVNILSRKLKSSLFQQFRLGYIVLLPEISPEGTEKNALFKNALPVEELTTEKLVTSFGNTIIDFEHAIRQTEDRLIDDGGGETKVDLFPDVVEALGEASAPFESSWGLLKAIYLADSSLLPQQNYLPLHDRARRARYVKYSSHYIYNAFKSCDLSKITEEEQRVVAKYLIEGKLNGLELTGENKLIFTEINRKLAQESNTFRKKVELSKGMFRHGIQESSLLREFPESLAMACRGAISLAPEVYPRVLKYCPDGLMRRSIWLAATRFPPQNSELNTSINLEEIRASRGDLATLLGYQSFADMSLETKIASSVEEIYSTFDSISDVAMGQHQKEIEDLDKFAKESGHRGHLDVYDVPYFAEKYRKKILGWNDEEMKAYFPLENVLTGLSQVLSEGLGVSLVQAPHSKTWHPSASAYSLVDNQLSDNINLGTIILDPIARMDKRLGNHTIRIRGSGETPLITLISSFPPPSPDTPTLLTLDQVESLLAMFGTALQLILSNTNYSEVSGTTFIEWDAVDVVPNVLKLSLENDEVLKKISGHYKTGEKLTSDTVRAARQHMIGTRVCEELYRSELGLRLHSSKDFWLSIVRDLWPKYHCLPQDKDDYSLLLDTELALDAPCSYYSRIWSEFLAHDVNQVTSLSQTDNPLSMRFRETLLSFGGSCHAGEVLRRYQGRDSSPQTFIEYIKSAR